MHTGAISSYTVNSDGSLTLINGTAYTIPNGSPLAMTLDASGKYLVVSGYVSAGSWNAISLKIGSAGSLTLVNTLLVSSGEADNIQPDPSLSNGDYLYGSGLGYAYEISLTAGGVISVTANSSIASNNSNIEPYPGWIDPTGTWLFLAELNGANDSEALVQYQINSDGSLTAGSMTPIQISSSNGSVGGSTESPEFYGSVGGSTESPGFYDSANGIVAIPVGGRLTTYSYNALNGSLTALSLNTGDAPGGIMVAYAP